MGTPASLSRSGRASETRRLVGKNRNVRGLKSTPCPCPQRTPEGRGRACEGTQPVGPRQGLSGSGRKSGIGEYGANAPRWVP